MKIKVLRRVPYTATSTVVTLWPIKWVLFVALESPSGLCEREREQFSKLVPRTSFSFPNNNKKEALFECCKMNMGKIKRKEERDFRPFFALRQSPLLTRQGFLQRKQVHGYT